MFLLWSILTVLNCFNNTWAHSPLLRPFDCGVPERSQYCVVPAQCKRSRKSLKDTAAKKQKGSVCRHQFLQLLGPLPRVILTSPLWRAPLCSSLQRRHSSSEVRPLSKQKYSWNYFVWLLFYRLQQKGLSIKKKCFPIHKKKKGKYLI